jgi:amidohydrolase
MHACGHDGHCSALLAAARIFIENQASIKGTIKLVFQPAEEGFGGAREMIADGVLSGVASNGTLRPDLGPVVDEIYGIHLWTYSPLGSVCIKHGPLMAASDKFEIDVCGHGGHGAHPQGTVDAIIEAAHVVTALQTVVSRNRDPLDAAVLTCGTIHGGHGYNIIADKVTIQGTTRTFTPETKALVQKRMEEVCHGVASTFGGDIALHYHDGYPATVNRHPAAVKRVQDVAGRIVGTGNILDNVMTCGAEDFSYFINEKPGAFFFVGAALPGECRPHHKSVFDFDERCMLISASMFVQLIKDILWC